MWCPELWGEEMWRAIAEIEIHCVWVLYIQNQGGREEWGWAWDKSDFKDCQF
jgi:hypothetical protein